MKAVTDAWFEDPKLSDEDALYIARKVSAGNQSNIVTENVIKIYQGRNVYNKKSKYFTTDKEWARNFTQSGLDSEIFTKTIDTKNVYKHNPLPEATDVNQLDYVKNIAKSKGFFSIWVDEGKNEPNSILFI